MEALWQFAAAVGRVSALRPTFSAPPRPACGRRVHGASPEPPWSRWPGSSTMRAGRGLYRKNEVRHGDSTLGRLAMELPWKRASRSMEVPTRPPPAHLALLSWKPWFTCLFRFAWFACIAFVSCVRSNASRTQISSLGRGRPLQRSGRFHSR